MPPGCFRLTDEEWQFVAAHLRRRRILPIEEELLRVLEEPKTKRDVYWAVIGLRDVGSPRCIPALKTKLHYPLQDVKDCVLLTIAHIAGEAETPFYVQALQDKRTRKTYPMWAIAVAGDDRAVAPVAEYVTTVLKKVRRSSSPNPGDAYLKGLEFLARFRDSHPEVKPVFDLALEVFPMLPADHQNQLSSVFR